MATIQNSVNRNVAPRGGVVLITWTPMANGDVGAQNDMTSYGDKTYTVTGTFGAAGSVAIEGSNDGTNWFPMANRQGVAMAFTAGGINTSQDRPIYTRPRVTAGDGTTALTVQLAAHHSDISVAG